MKKTSFFFFVTTFVVIVLSLFQSANAQKNDKFKTSRNVIPNRYIVVLSDDVVKVNDIFSNAIRADVVNKVSSDLVNAYGGRVDMIYSAALKGYAVEMSREAAQRLSLDPRVKYVEEDFLVFRDETQINAPWGLDRIDQRIGRDGNYNYTSTGANVHAYIIDTGIRTTHNEFTGRIGNGKDFINDGQNGNDCDGHGTHVAGTVGGTTYGVAKQVTLHSLRVFPCEGEGSGSGSIGAIDWITLNHIKPAVVNMSLGGSYQTSFNSALQTSISQGITYVVSAGNENNDACDKSPASTTNAITVGATNINESRSSFSNYGSCVDIFAPGSQILSAWFTSDTATNTINGTSMATPHVTGAVALFLQANPTASPAQVANSIINAATVGAISNVGPGSPNLLLYTFVPFNASPPPMPAPSPAPAVRINEGGPATPYPSIFSVSGLSGVIANTLESVRVRINGFSHSYPGEVAMVLEGPTGARLLIQGKVGKDGEDANNLTYTISDSGSVQMSNSTLINGTSYKPTALGVSTFPVFGTAYNNPGPVNGGAATFASTFGGTNPNGQWKLFVLDEENGDRGRIDSWSLDIVTSTMPPPKPDLVVSNFQVTPATVNENDAVNFSVAITNQGNAPTPNEWIGILYTIDGACPPAGCIWSGVVASIAPGQTITVNGSNMPWTARSGWHSVEVLIDDQGRISESNESNNTASRSVFVNPPSPATKPDLVVTNITTNPSSPNAGDSVNFSATITNQGNAPTANEWVGILYTIDGACPPAGCIWSGIVTSLAPGQSVTVQGASAPWNAISGNHTISAFVDDQGRISESNESNNIGNLNVAVTNNTPTAKPDLVVTNITTNPASPNNGDAVNFSATITNQGNAPTPNEFIGILYTIDGTCPPSGCIWSGIVTSLAPGQSVTVQGASAPWMAAAGNHTISAFVDDQGRISESNESNNVGNLNVTVTNNAPSAKPDLVVSDIQISPASPNAGTAVNFSATITNQGNAATPNEFIGILYTIDGACPPSGCIWSGLVGTIAPGQSVTVQGASAPWNAISGNHTISAFVDDQGRINESNESNNLSNKVVSVGSQSIASAESTSADPTKTTAASPNKGETAPPPPITETVSPVSPNKGEMTMDTRTNAVSPEAASPNAVQGGNQTGNQINNPNINPNLNSTDNQAVGFIGFDDQTKGNWKNVYGKQGVIIIGEKPNLFDSIRFGASGHGFHIWEPVSRDERALVKTDNNNDRIAAALFAPGRFELTLDLTDGQMHRLAIYAVDWEGASRQQTYEIVDAATGQMIDTRTIQNFNKGVYTIWQVRGRIVVRIRNNAAQTLNAAVSGVFIDAP